MFARQFKPKISKASADFMVEEYKKLRQRDCSGGCGLVGGVFGTYVFFISRGRRVQVVMENHRPTAGEYDTTLGGNVTDVLLGRSEE